MLGLVLVLGCAGRATSVAEVGGASSASGGATGDAAAGATSVSGGAGGNASAGASTGGASAGATSAGNTSAGAFDAGTCAPVECPAQFFGLQLVVTSSVGDGQLMGVQAALSGPATIPMSCGAEMDGTFCYPKMGGPEGNYTLQVTAPGFQSVTVPATATFTPAPRCGCGGATLDPSTVTLNALPLR
jgi:hypothetical protein